jgi:hypothetical protein
MPDSPLVGCHSCMVTAFLRVFILLQTWMDFFILVRSSYNGFKVCGQFGFFEGGHCCGMAIDVDAGGLRQSR